MFMQRLQVCKREKGFTLIELMIVVAIIGILAAVAVPNFISYRNKSRVGSVVGTGEGVRASMASFAADSTGNAYPTAATITNYTQLRSVANANGATLPTNNGNLTFVSYGVTLSADGVPNDYSMRWSVKGVPTTQNGNQILVTPAGILKCTGATTASCA